MAFSSLEVNVGLLPEIRRRVLTTYEIKLIINVFKAKINLLCAHKYSFGASSGARFVSITKNGLW
jgi:hypothetical protein